MTEQLFYVSQSLSLKIKDDNQLNSILGRILLVVGILYIAVVQS